MLRYRLSVAISYAINVIYTLTVLDESKSLFNCFRPSQHRAYGMLFLILERIIATWETLWTVPDFQMRMASMKKLRQVSAHNTIPKIVHDFEMIWTSKQCYLIIQIWISFEKLNNYKKNRYGRLEWKKFIKLI